MTSPRRFLALVAVLAILGAVAGGCGSSEPEVKVPLGDPNAPGPKPTSIQPAAGGEAPKQEGAPQAAGSE